MHTKRARNIDIKHLLIRFALLLAIPTITVIVAKYLIIPSIYDTEYDRGYAGIMTVYIVMIEIFTMIGLILLETIWLALKKRTPKRNANLLLLFTFIAYLVIHVAFLRQ